MLPAIVQRCEVVHQCQAWHPLVTILLLLLLLLLSCSRKKSAAPNSICRQFVGIAPNTQAGFSFGSEYKEILTCRAGLESGWSR